MNEHIIGHWRETVSPWDHVWVLGDMFFTRQDEAISIMESLTGIIHLVMGNHDGVIQSSGKLQSLFASIDYYKELKFGNQDIALFHFPIREWNKMHYGAWHFHGHCHGKIQQDGRSLDVGWDGPIGPKLLTLDDIRPFMTERPILTHHSNGLPNEKIIAGA